MQGLDGRPQAYIASQGGLVMLHCTINDKFLTGPTEASMDDFWRMIWEHNTTTIVMLTGLLENGKVGRRIYHNSR